MDKCQPATPRGKGGDGKGAGVGGAEGTNGTAAGSEALN